VQVGFIFALLPLYTVGQIFLVQLGLRRLASQIEQIDSAAGEVTQHVKSGDCESLNPAEQPKCFSQLASEKRDPELCMRIGSGSVMEQFKRDFCLSDVAERAENLDICHQIQRSSVAATCIRKVLESMNIGQRIARSTSYPSHGDICAQFVPKGDIDEEEKSACYREVAIYERNPAICERISSLTLQEDCKNSLPPPTGSGMNSDRLEVSSSSIGSDTSLPGEMAFSSKYFTISFLFPSGFEVRDQQNSIRIAKAPFTDRDIGDDNAFFGLTRYSQYNTQETEPARYRKLLMNQKESTIMIDGGTFPTLSGEDWGRFEGTSAGKVFVVFFPKSWLEIIERPANADQTFDPIAVGKKILSTMKFSK
jgi:hypothetical protein